MSVVLPSNFDVSKLNFEEIKSLKSGMKIVKVNYDGSPLNMQTPELRLPFDVSEYKDNENFKYSFQCSLDNMEGNKAMKDLYTKLSDIDVAVRNFAMENSLAFFKKKTMTDETIDQLYNPIVKVSKDPETGEPNGKYAPSFKVKFNKRDGKFMTKLYDNKKNVFDINGDVDVNTLLVRDTKCKLLIEFTGLWLINGKFGCGWNVVQGLVNKPKKGLDDFAFIDDGSDNVDFVDSESEEDEDEDEDESESEEEVVRPQTVKKSRKVKSSK